MQEAGPDPQSGDLILPRQVNMSRMPPDLRESSRNADGKEYIRLLIFIGSRIWTAKSISKTQSLICFRV